MIENVLLRQFLVKTLAAAILANVLLIFFPGSLSSLAIVAALSCTLYFLSSANALLTAFTFLFCTLLLEGMVRVSPGLIANPYYRPHEMLAAGPRYMTNKEVDISSPHGDLLAVDPLLDRSLGQVRQLRFKTDSLGYRNDNDYANEKLILIGDSFVVGNGNTQADTLSNVLRNQFDIPSYSLAFPNGPLGYARLIGEARARFGDGVCIVSFYFEGNDFQIIDVEDLKMRALVPVPLKQVAQSYIHSLKRSFEISKVFFGLITQGQKRAAHFIGGLDKSQTPNKQVPKTFVRDIGGQPMVFLRGYAEVTRRTSYEDHDFLKNHITENPPDLAIFIPEKFRVYANHVGGEEMMLPNAQLDHLVSVAVPLGIDVVDISRALIKGAQQLVDQGRFVYWLDDTHWRRDGIEIAAQQVAHALATSADGNCASVVAE